jgi:hypothetical protein
MAALTDSNVKRDITPIVEGYTNPDSAAEVMAPYVKVLEELFSYNIVSDDNEGFISTVVGEYGEAISLNTDAEQVHYKVRFHFPKVVIPQRIIDNSISAVIDWVQEETQRMMEYMEWERNRDLAGLITTTGSYITSNHAIPGVLWSDPLGDPAKDVSAILQQIVTATGHHPSGIGMTPDVKQKLSNDYVRSIDGNMGAASDEAILKYFSADGGLKNLSTCNSRSAAGGTNVYGTGNFWIYFNDPNPGMKEISFASTFRYDAGRYQKQDSPVGTRGQVVYIHEPWVVKVRNFAACYYFHGVL